MFSAYPVSLTSILPISGNVISEGEGADSFLQSFLGELQPEGEALPANSTLTNLTNPVLANPGQKAVLPNVSENGSELAPDNGGGAADDSVDEILSNLNLMDGNHLSAEAIGVTIAANNGAAASAAISAEARQPQVATSAIAHADIVSNNINRPEITASALNAGRPELNAPNAGAAAAVSPAANTSGAGTVTPNTNAATPVESNILPGQQLAANSRADANAEPSFNMQNAARLETIQREAMQPSAPIQANGASQPAPQMAPNPLANNAISAQSVAAANNVNVTARVAGANNGARTAASDADTPVVSTSGMFDAGKTEIARNAPAVTEFNSAEAPQSFSKLQFADPASGEMTENGAQVKELAIDGTDNVGPEVATRSSRSAMIEASAAQQAAVPPVMTIETGSPLGKIDISGSFGVDEGQAVMSRSLDMARGDMWLNDLAKDIVAARQSDARLNFSLSPENLGDLDVDIINGDDGVSVKMAVSSEEAARMISSAQGKLAEELRSQGVRVADTEISARAETQGGASGQSQNDGQAGRNGPQQRFVEGQDMENLEVNEDKNSEAEADRSGRFA